MSRRTICIQTPAKVSIAHSMLQIETEDKRALIPFEEIWVLIIETHRAQVTTAALSRLSDEQHSR